MIGPKGKIINQIQEDTGADITIEDDGHDLYRCDGRYFRRSARTAINNIANPTMPEVGERVPWERWSRRPISVPSSPWFRVRTDCSISPR